MGILFCMAACAIPRQAAVLVRGAVAGGAGYLLVRSGQRVFAIGMVERTSIESDEAEVAPLVVGMAGLAGAAASLGDVIAEAGWQLYGYATPEEARRILLA